MAARCAYCDDPAPPTATAACSNRCALAAHAACVARRRASPAWKRKNGQRAGRDAEVCPTPGCAGKVSCRAWAAEAAAEAAEAAAEGAPRARRGGRGRPHREAPELDDPERPCGFVGRDGHPCRRAALGETGACRLHAADAAAMRRLARGGAGDARRDVGVQASADDDEFVALREELAALRREAAAARAGALAEVRAALAALECLS